MPRQIDVRDLRVGDEHDIALELRQAGHNGNQPLVVPVSQLDLTIECLRSQFNALNHERTRHEKAIANLEAAVDAITERLIKRGKRIQALEADNKELHRQLDRLARDLHRYLNQNEDPDEA